MFHVMGLLFFIRLPVLNPPSSIDLVRSEHVVPQGEFVSIYPHVHTVMKFVFVCSRGAGTTDIGMTRQVISMDGNSRGKIVEFSNTILTGETTSPATTGMHIPSDRRGSW